MTTIYTHQNDPQMTTKWPGVNEISISISISTILGTIDLDLDGNIILLDIDIFYF